MTAAQHPVRSDFAYRLKANTRAEHAEAAAIPFIQALMNGEINSEIYGKMLAQHYLTYEVLEEAADFMRSDLVAGPFVTDRLRRLPALEADLAYFFGSDWADILRTNPATEDYRARLREVCFDWPGGFVAHHYTRYFAELSGGQAIRSVISRSLDLPGTDGLAFYTFTEIPSRPRFKDAYRMLLDTAGWSDNEQQRIIAEAKLAYRLSTQLFAELGQYLAPHIPVQRA